jgi:hypothetical protein
VIDFVVSCVELFLQTIGPCTVLVNEFVVLNRRSVEFPTQGISFGSYLGALVRQSGPRTLLRGQFRPGRIELLLQFQGQTDGLFGAAVVVAQYVVLCNEEFEVIL